MTRVYDDAGRQVPVTVVQVGPCVVVQQKVPAKDGYAAAQLGFEEQKESRLAKSVKGHFAKQKVPVRRVLREVPLDEGEEVKPGDQVTAAMFEGVAYVDVIGTTKGRGFQGVVRRFRMAGGPAAHGSGTHRRPGSVGNREWPGRLFRNKKLPGHMGNERVTTQNLRVVKVLSEDHALLLEGAVPGPNGRIVMVRKVIKKATKKAS